MEDREIASRAVAFVVNSTRKGFVPLCANVAALMRSKRRSVARFVSKISGFKFQLITVVRSVIFSTLLSVKC